jgi:multicomponent Na+:H+ antiporter subunit G
MILHSGFTLATAKLLAIMVFLLLTGPTATYTLANAAYTSGLKPSDSDPTTIPPDHEDGSEP